MNKNELEMIKLVNANRDYEEIGKYIISVFYRMNDKNQNNKYELDFTREEYSKIEQYLLVNFRKEAQKLVKRTKISKEDILSGKAEFEIFKSFRILQAQFMSVKDENKHQEIDKRNKEIDLKTKKKIKERNERIKKLAVAIGLSTAITIVGLGVLDAYIDHKEDKEVTSAIGYLVSDEENDKRNIVEQNVYRSGFDQKGKSVYSYNAESIAYDIIGLCQSNPELLDIALYNVYTNLGDNKLSTMDSVIIALKDISKNNENDNEVLNYIFSKLDNCRVFLDYLVNRGFLNPNSSDYYAVLSDIEMYIETKVNGAEGFERLPDLSKKRLQNLLDNFIKNRDNLYSEYKEVIEGMAGEGFGSR